MLMFSLSYSIMLMSTGTRYSMMVAICVKKIYKGLVFSTPTRPKHLEKLHCLWVGISMQIWYIHQQIWCSTTRAGNRRWPLKICIDEMKWSRICILSRREGKFVDFTQTTYRTKYRNFFIAIWILHFARTVLQQIRLDLIKMDYIVSRRKVKREEFLFRRVHGLFIELMEVLLSWGTGFISHEELDRRWEGLKAYNPSLSRPAMSMVLVTWSLT